MNNFASMIVQKAKQHVRNRPKLLRDWLFKEIDQKMVVEGCSTVVISLDNVLQFDSGIIDDDLTYLGDLAKEGRFFVERKDNSLYINLFSQVTGVNLHSLFSNTPNGYDETITSHDKDIVQTGTIGDSGVITWDKKPEDCRSENCWVGMKRKTEKCWNVLKIIWSDGKYASVSLLNGKIGIYVDMGDTPKQVYRFLGHIGFGCDFD